MYQYGRVRFREHRREEAGQYLAWLNDLTTARNLSGGGPMPYTLEQEERWIEENAGRRNGLCNFAVENEVGELIGGCGLFDIDHKNRRCMLGLFVGPAGQRSKGYGYEMLRLLLSIAFEELALEKVSLEVYAYNEAAVHLYEKAGFSREGVFRRHAFSGGRWWDEYRYAILLEEWRALYGK